MKNMISPSLMCADFFDLKNTIKIFENLNIEYLHIDIMDGHFVPNFTLGNDFCRILKNNTKIPLDIHLMIENPECFLEDIPFGVNDIVSVHAESTYHIQKCLQIIKQKGAHPYIALNPATSTNVLEYILNDIDGVVVMTVNPGFAGQKVIPDTLKKISDIKQIFNNKNLFDKNIEVDGNVSFENAIKMKQCGANIFVAGTSSIFSPLMTLEEGITKMRDCIG